MEHPATDSTGSIDTNQAGAMFASLFTEPAEPDKAKPKAEPAKAEPAQAAETDRPLTEDEALDRAAAEEAGNAQPEGDDAKPEPLKVTVQVDGKAVELTPEEIADAYKSGMRQSDYTRKTTEAAEMRKTADAELARANAEIAAARQDRQAYAQNLQMLGQQLQSVMQDQSQIDWQRLSVENPSEYVRQKHLADQRQAAAMQVRGEQNRVMQQQQTENARQAQQRQAEHAQAQESYVKQQREDLLAKLPEWKDGTKAEAEQASIAKYLQNAGFNKEEIASVTDHRAVVLADKAMRYDKLMAKAKASSGKVEKLPARVERPGTATAPSDGRTAAMQRLEKSGRVEDAGAIFAEMFK